MNTDGKGFAMPNQPLDYAQPEDRSFWGRAWPVGKWVLIVVGLVAVAALVFLVAIIHHVNSFGPFDG